VAKKPPKIHTFIRHQSIITKNEKLKYCNKYFNTNKTNNQIRITKLKPLVRPELMLRDLKGIVSIHILTKYRVRVARLIQNSLAIF
jgi:hypothetical protein